MKNIITVLILVLAVLMTACDGDNGVSAASTTTYDQPTSSELVVTPSSSSEVVYYPDLVPVKWSGYYGKICDKVMQFKDEITTSTPDIAMTLLETTCPRSDIYYLKCSDLESIYQRIRRISITYTALSTPGMYNEYVWFDFTDLKAFVMIFPCEFE